MPQTARTPSTSSSRWKRAAKITAGGTLAIAGLARRTLPGYAAALAGGWLAYDGVTSGPRRIELAELQGLEASAENIEVQRSLIVQASPDEVRAFLEDPANLDAVLGPAGTVESLSEARQRWELEAPLGYTLSWEMRREDIAEADEMAWTSVGEAEIEVTLGMRPAPGDRGTELALKVDFAPPGGGIGRAVMDRLNVVPHELAGKTLRRAQSLIETGELPTLEASPSSREAPSPGV